MSNKNDMPPSHFETPVISTPTPEQLEAVKQIGHLTNVTMVAVGSKDVDEAERLIQEIGELTGAHVVFDRNQLDTLKTKLTPMPQMDVASVNLHDAQDKSQQLPQKAKAEGATKER